MALRKKIQMEVPDGFAVSHQGSTLVAMSDEGAIVASKLGPIAKRQHLSHIEAIGAPVEDVAFGKIRGRKCELGGRIIYYLHIGRSLVQVGAQTKGPGFDPNTLEQYLETLRFE